MSIKKINPFSLTRPAQITETRSFEDPLHPGQVLELCLKSLDTAESTLAFDFTNVMIRQYCGDPETDTPPEMPFPAVDGREVVISESLCRSVGSLYLMQVGDSPEDKYTFEQLVALAVTMPNAWKKVMEWTRDLVKGISSKNASKVD